LALSLPLTGTAGPGRSGSAEPSKGSRYQLANARTGARDLAFRRRSGWPAIVGISTEDVVRRPPMEYLFIRSREFALSEIARLKQRPENGQGMVEYALILVLIAVVVIVILSTVGKRVNNIFSNISNGLSS
jgi:pilus assembly protein Flp/PilA